MIECQKLTLNSIEKERNPELTMERITNGYVVGDEEYHGMAIDDYHSVNLLFEDMIWCCQSKKVDVRLPKFRATWLIKIGT
jgi:hypothetical protein